MSFLLTVKSVNGKFVATARFDDRQTAEKARDRVLDEGLWELSGDGKRVQLLSRNQVGSVEVTDGSSSDVKKDIREEPA